MGIWLWQGYGYAGLWLRIKLLLVLGLIGYHLVCRYVRAAPAPRRAAAEAAWCCDCSTKAALLLVVPILIMAIVKPTG